LFSLPALKKKEKALVLYRTRVKIRRMRILSLVSLGVAAAFMFLTAFPTIGYIFLAVSFGLSLYIYNLNRRLKKRLID